MSNMWEIGMVIAFLHDIADVTTNITKAGAHTNYTKFIVLVFIIHMITWAWTRLYVLPV